MERSIKALIILLLTACLSGYAHAQTGFENIYTTGNEKWLPGDTAQYYILLKNSKTCLKCYPELYSYLQEHVNPQAVIGCLSIIDSSVFSRKKEARELSKLIPGIPLMLFDYYDATARNIQTRKNTSVFSIHNIDVTPALVIIKNGNIQYYPYEDLYDKSGVRFDPAKL